MIHKILDKIDALLAQSNLNPAQKKELDQLYQQLREELVILAKTDPQNAKTIADFAAIATLEALRDDSNRDMTESVKERLMESLETFETSHPKLANVLQTLITHLSGIGL